MESFLKVLNHYLEASKARGAQPKIGRFDLAKFQDEELKTVQIWMNQSNRAAVGSGSRIGSVCLTKDRAVVLNISLYHEVSNGPSAFGVIAMGNEVLLLHEFMCALGYPDDHCELSCYYWARAFPADYGEEVFALWEQEIANHLARVPQRTTNMVVASGTSTGVGGGGDPAAFSVKVSALSFLGGRRKDKVMDRFRLSQDEYVELVRAVILLAIDPADMVDPYAEAAPEASLGFVRVNRRGKVAYAEVNTQQVLASPIDKRLTIGAQLITELLRVRAEME